MPTTAQDISLPLYREVKPAGIFAGLFPHSDCKSKKLGNGHNTTFDGVDMMVDIVNRHHDQTAKVAPLLKGKSLKETVENIHSFLYHYFQYQADDALQQLRSPACSWAQRHEGMDCKSYTILAMSILENLGITGAIRQVRQPGFYEDLWTHVYVVVPKNQKKDFKKQLNNPKNYFVIDGTTHHNVEVDFTQKNDTLMQAHQYVGLNAPNARFIEIDSPAYFQALEKSGLPEDLFLFRDHLVGLGQPKPEVKAIIRTLKGYFDKGFEFDEMVMFEDHWGRLNIQPNRVTQGLAIPISGSMRGLGVVSLVAAGATAAPELGGIAMDSSKAITKGVSKLFDNLFGSKQHRADQRINGTPTILDWIIGKSGLAGEVNSKTINEWSRLFHLWLSEQERVTDRHYSKKRRQGAEWTVDFAHQYKDQVFKNIKNAGIEIKQTGTKSLNGNSVIYPLGPNEGGSKISYPSDNKHGHGSQKTTSYPVYTVTGGGKIGTPPPMPSNPSDKNKGTSSSNDDVVEFRPGGQSSAGSGFMDKIKDFFTDTGDSLRNAGIPPLLPLGILAGGLIMANRNRDSEGKTQEVSGTKSKSKSKSKKKK